jgi:eukaryotic-like serine/threonine-protein kinase
VRAEPEWPLLPKQTPSRVRVLLRRCLEKDPRQRLQAIGEARITIDEVLRGAAGPGVAGAVLSEAPLWRRATPAWAVGACLAIALAALAFLYVRGNSHAPTAGAIRFEIPAPEKAVLGPNFTLSPDGRQLAFAATGADGVGRIWLRNMDSLEARPLSGSERTGAVQPPFFWSPDSRYIAFDAAGKLKKIDVTSGTAETLCDVSSLVVGGSWNRDGVIIFGQSLGGIMRVSASGGNASPLTTVDASRAEVLHTLPEFLPDERHFLYHRVSTKAEIEGIYVGSIDAKPNEQDLRRVLADDYAGVYTPSSDAGLGELLFVRDRALMAQLFDASRFELAGEPVTLVEGIGTYNDKGLFSASTNGALVYRTDNGSADEQLTWFDRQGRVLGKAGERGPYSDPALSPDGTHAAVARRDFRQGGYSIWLVDFSQGGTTRFTFGAATAAGPVWSADGKRIIFMSDPSGIFDIYQKPADGSAEEELLVKSDELKQPEDVSRDGRFLLYLSIGPKTKPDLWVLPLTGGRKPFPFLRTEFAEHSAKFSPDGHWVAYTSDESGRDEVYVRKFSPDETADASETGGKWQVSYDGGNEPLWGLDGKQLYYLALDAKVMVAGVATSPSFEAGKPMVLFQAPPRRGVYTGHYTIDGKRFLFLAPAEQASQAQAPFTIVLNWQAALKPQQ